MGVTEMNVGGRPFQEGKQAAQYYESIIRTRDCANLIKLVMSIYEKKQSLAKNDRHIGSMEATAMKRAEEMLFEELAVALDIPKERVQKYIEARIDGKPATA